VFFTQFSRKDVKLMRKLFSTVRGKVLDLGCGDFVHRLGFTPGDQYVGIDISKTKYTTVLGDIQNLPFKNESFDCCICNAVLEHVEEPLKALKECKRVLRKGGMLWLSVPFLQPIHANDDFRRWTNEGIVREVKRTGFLVSETYASYGVLDTLEYLLFNAIGWKIFKEKTGRRFGSILYISVLAILFLVVRILAIVFGSHQNKDIRYAISFVVIGYKE